MGLHQRVQRGNAVHLILEAVLLRGVRGDAHGGDAVEIGTGRLRTDGNIGGGHGRRAALHSHGNGVDLGFAGVFHVAVIARVAAGDSDDRAVGHGNHGQVGIALIRGAAHGGMYLIVLVDRNGVHRHRGRISGDSQRVGIDVLAESGRQLAGAEGQGLEASVRVRKVAADVSAHIHGEHDADLITGLQLAVADGEVGEALVDEPVVQRAHPAAAFAAALFTESVDGLQVSAILALDNIGLAADVFDCLLNTGHHGGLRVEIDPLVYQCSLPRSALGLGEGGVLHDDTYLIIVPCREHGGGDQAEHHHQCHQQRSYAFLHL